MFDEARLTWGVGSSANTTVRGTEYDLERAVSTVIGAMDVLWLSIDDPPSAGSARAVVEVGTIALLSNWHRSVIDPPSPIWLGRHTNRPEIVASGLWNVRHVNENWSTHVLQLMSDWIDTLPEHLGRRR